MPPRKRAAALAEPEADDQAEAQPEATEQEQAGRPRRQHLLRGDRRQRFRTEGAPS